MKRIPILAATLTAVSLFVACGNASHDAAGGDGHEHGPDDDHSHDEADEAHDAVEAEGGGHGHDEEPLGTVKIGSLDVQLAQGHGAVAAGKEGHLVVKLPYSDSGATVVRAWIGTADRLDSYVGKGQYAADHDDYDVHATAPTPLPADTAWWIEIEQPDGTRHVGWAKAIQ